MDTARRVAKSWMGHPEIPLVYTTAPQFDTLVEVYAVKLTGRLSTGSSRPSQTQTLAQLDAAIVAGVKEVKVYIEKKYKTANAVAQFPRFGIIKENKAYMLPRDRNKRLASLQLMLDAIMNDGFQAEEYGSDFWQGMLQNYKATLEASNTTDSAVSDLVGNKNVLKAEIKKVMKSLRKVLEGNYPDTYSNVYRDWGWQKEDY